jgi:hypothetical protein
MIAALPRIIGSTRDCRNFFRNAEILRGAIEVGEVNEDGVVEELLQIDREAAGLSFEAAQHLPLDRHLDFKAGAGDQVSHKGARKRGSRRSGLAAVVA